MDMRGKADCWKGPGFVTCQHLVSTMRFFFASLVLVYGLTGVAGQSCRITLGLWTQCGGKSGECQKYVCDDNPFPNTCCPAGSFCNRQNEWYRQCIPLTVPTSTKPSPLPQPSPSPSPSPPSVPAPANGFLGCFLRNGITVSMSQGVSTTPTPTTCKQWCEVRLQGLALITKRPDGKLECECSNTLPGAPQSTFNGCGASLASGSTMVFYNTGATSTCRLELIPFNDQTLEAAYNRHMATLSGASMDISMDKGGQGTRLHMRGPNVLHGMYQVEAKISPVSGVVSAFYLRNDYYQETSDFSEIDYEWINGSPMQKETVWLNTYKGGVSNGEFAFIPRDYQAITNNSTTRTGSQFNTYTINWKPSSVTWFMNNAMLRQQIQGAWYETRRGNRTFQNPDKASHITFSIWTANGGFGGFGGTLDATAPSPYISQFRNLRRIVCGA